jgi:hypothetical protein
MIGKSSIGVLAYRQISTDSGRKFRCANDLLGRAWRKVIIATSNLHARLCGSRTLQTGPGNAGSRFHALGR